MVGGRAPESTRPLTPISNLGTSETGINLIDLTGSSAWVHLEIESHKRFAAQVLCFTA